MKPIAFAALLLRGPGEKYTLMRFLKFFESKGFLEFMLFFITKLVTSNPAPL
jgi:hypothetical protein